MSGWLRVEYDKFKAADKTMVDFVYQWALAVRSEQSYAEDDRLAASDVIRGLEYLMTPPEKQVVTITKQGYDHLRGKDAWAPNPYPTIQSDE